MIICPMLLRTFEHCSSGPDWLTCKLGLTQHSTCPYAAQLYQHLPVEISQAIAPQTSHTLHLNFPLNPTHPWKTTLKVYVIIPLSVSDGIRSDDRYIPRQWSSYLRRERSKRWCLMKMGLSILYVDLFPLILQLQPLNFKPADPRLCLSDRWHKTPRKLCYELKICSRCSWRWKMITSECEMMLLKQHILASLVPHYFCDVISTMRKCWSKNTKHSLPSLMVEKPIVYLHICEHPC